MRSRPLLASAFFLCCLVMLGCGEKSDTGGQSASKDPPKKDDPKPAPKKDPKADPKSKSKTPPPDPKREPLGEAKYKLSIDELVEEGRKDPQAAHTKYAGKILEVRGYPTGPAQWVTESEMKLRFVARGGTGVMTCSGVLPSYEGKLFAGQLITAKGEVREIRQGLGGLEIALVKTEVPEIGPAKPMRMSSSEVAKEAAANLIVFSGRTERESLIVTGKVVRLIEGGSTTQVELPGSGKTRLVCRIESTYARLFEPQFKVGEQVTFVGYVAASMDEEKNIVFVDDCMPFTKP